MTFECERRRSDVGPSPPGIVRHPPLRTRRILAGIFGRVFAQLAIGLAIGLMLSGGVIWASVPPADARAVFAAVSVVILGVGLASACGPARRGLAIEVTEALRSE